MIEFFADFLDAVRTVPVTRYALLAGLVSSLTFGVVGSLVVVRQISYIASAIAHSILGGIGAAVYFGRVHDLPWLTPMVGSILAGAVSVALIGWVTLRFKEREDTIISAIWATGMAAGLLFLHYAPGKAMNLESFIFGNILLTSKDDVAMTFALGMVVIVLVVLFYHKLVSVSFDEEFTLLRGVSSKAYHFLLLGLIAMSVVLMVRLVGLFLAQALLVLPAATASRFSRSLGVIMAVAVVLAAVANTAGLAVSYGFDIPTGPFIVFVAVGFYALSFLLRRRRA